MILTIRPLLQMNIEKLLTDRVDKLLSTVNRQDTKLTKIADVLQSIYTIKSKNYGQKNAALHPQTPTPDSVKIWTPLKQSSDKIESAIDLKKRK